jgi:hypothetical protein
MAGYGTDNGFTDWLTGNGFSLPAGASSPAALRQIGSVYVDAHAFPGAPTGGFAQDRAWPRSGALAYGQDIPLDVIPSKVVDAAYAAGYFEALNPGALTTRSPAIDQQVKRKKERVEGVVEEETEYFAAPSTGDSAKVTVSMAEDLLKPFVLSTDAEPTFYIV